MSGGITRPINGPSPGCKPVSSECVVWQGPDLPCIDLCKGDRISMVIYKLACKLCELLALFNVKDDTYDLSCLSLSKCDVPENIAGLIQILINQICAIKAQLTALTNGEGSSDSTMVVASCFQAEYGVTLSMMDYVAAIGARYCAMEITIQNQQTAIAQLTARVEALEA